MKTRENPLVIPDDDARYFRLEAGGRTFHLKQPFPLDVSDLIAATRAASGGDGDSTTRLSANWEQCGAALGIAWSDPSMELESERTGEWGEYGRAVLRELFDEWQFAAPGYGELFPPLMRALTASLVGSKEVADAADFTEPTEARPVLPN